MKLPTNPANTFILRPPPSAGERNSPDAILWRTVADWNGLTFSRDGTTILLCLSMCVCVFLSARLLRMYRAAFPPGVASCRSNLPLWAVARSVHVTSAK